MELNEYYSIFFLTFGHPVISSACRLCSPLCSQCEYLRLRITVCLLCSIGCPSPQSSSFFYLCKSSLLCVCLFVFFFACYVNLWSLSTYLTTRLLVSTSSSFFFPLISLFNLLHYIILFKSWVSLGLWCFLYPAINFPFFLIIHL